VTGSDTDWTSSAGMTAAGWTGSDTVSAEVAACLLDFLGVEVLDWRCPSQTTPSRQVCEPYNQLAPIIHLRAKFRENQFSGLVD